jgi:hypothetical protein
MQSDALSLALQAKDQTGEDASGLAEDKQLRVEPERQHVCVAVRVACSWWFFSLDRGVKGLWVGAGWPFLTKTVT